MPLDLLDYRDGNAWVRSNGPSSFLCAGCGGTGRVASGVGGKLQEARRAPLAEVAEGNRRVKVTIQKSQPA